MAFFPHFCAFSGATQKTQLSDKIVETDKGQKRPHSLNHGLNQRLKVSKMEANVISEPDSGGLEDEQNNQGNC